MTNWLESVEIYGDSYPDPARYPFNIATLQGRQRLCFTSSTSFLVGENGSGKSTLLQAIARRCGVDMWAQPKSRLRPGELSSAALSEHLLVSLRPVPVSAGFFNAEGFREWAEFLDDVTEVDPGQAKYQGCAGLTRKSHGEGILAYLAGRYRRSGLYFLDEPETALSPASQVELLRALEGFRGSGNAQFLIATHSPILMALPESQIFHLSASGITETPYESTDHFRLYRDFLEDPRSFLS
jgi:predicted ATPase